MDKRIKSFSDMYFEDIPYSEEVAEAQAKTEAALKAEYERLSEDMPADEALEEIVRRYGTLSGMAQLAGYPVESAEKWRETGQARELSGTKKEIRRQRRRIYLTAFLSVAAFEELLWLVYDIARRVGIDILFVFIYVLIFGGWAFLVYRKFRRLEKERSADCYDTEAYVYLRSLADRYAKRRLNGIAILFAAVFLFFFSEMSFYVFGNSKSAEFAENFFSNSVLIEIPIYLCLKNLMCQRMISRRIKLPDDKRYKKHLIGITVFSAAYWLIVTAVTVILRNTLSYPANIFLGAGFLFVLLILIYNITLRRRVMYRNIVFNKPRVAVYTAAAVCIAGFSMLRRDTWYTQTYINSVPVVEHNEHKISYNDDTGVYTIVSSTDDFKILHLTDIHIGGSLYSYSKDLKALQACYAEIEHTHPDLVIVTGDLCFPLGIMSMSLNNTAPVNQFAAFMRNADIPWAFTYGNHDTESLASANKKELSEVYRSLSYKTSGNLLYPYTQPDITGRNNQLIEVRNTDGTLNTALFLIDSNAYTGEGINVYDYIHDDQEEWYASEVERLCEEEGHTVNSMAFFHIPLQEYRTAYELYESGSDEVTYFFGENGEKMINKVCCSDYPSSLFDTMLELGSTTGVFCGHDHYNNMSLEYKGIRLTYGMSIDYLAMPGIEDDTEQRGAELITLHPDSTWELEQIPLTSITEQ
ncbi:MAG: metallophosphoesterase [Ruminococcus sp.]|nr:metallophosphoesterase [Ruminococcus sp.]